MSIGDLTVSDINIIKKHSREIILSITLNYDENQIKMPLKSGFECKFSKTDFQIKEEEIPVLFEPLTPSGGGG